LTEPIKIRLGGYGPPETSFSRGLALIGERLGTHFGDRVDVKYVWNIMDLGYQGKDILWLVEDGILSLGYQSSSYLTDRVPDLGFADLPFLFKDNNEARAAMDGALGELLAGRIEAACRYRILGWFENGFRHISNKLRPIKTPADMAGLKIRVLPSDIQEKTFRLLGAEPMQLDLTEAIAGVVDGSLDAQENPFANTVTYGVHHHHKYHTSSGHFYLSRPIFLCRKEWDAWPGEVQRVMAGAVKDAVTEQRKMSEIEAVESRLAIEAAGCEIHTPSAAEHLAFKDAVAPLLEEAKTRFAAPLFEALKAAQAASR